MLPKICTIPECETIVGKNSARGWCFRHYQRWLRHGDPLGGGPWLPNLSTEERFWSKVEKTATCWNWTGATNEHGYGMVTRKDGQRRAHRVAWTTLVGDIPDGMQVDHRCRKRACVNPGHLRIETTKQTAEHVAISNKNTSGYRGVTFDKTWKKWRAQVRHCGKNYIAGYFTDVHEAGAAAKALRNELFTHNDLDRIAS